jgi:phosphotransferase system enzyme I (PtsP)
MAQKDIEVRIHHGDARLTAMTRLGDLASQRRPLPRILGAMCEEASVVFGADVVSLYLREGDVDAGESDELVMRGNVGLSGTVVDQVRLPMGQGVAGLAAESARAVSFDTASDAACFRPVPGIGEERYPAYCAVPLRVQGRVVGVLVMQRQTPFREDEVLLATASASAFTFAVERAYGRRREVRRRPPRNRSVRLTGMPVVWGTALGVAQALPSFESIAEAEGEGEGLDAQGLGEGWSDLVKELTRARRKRAPETSDPELDSILSDGRLAHALVTACASMGLSRGARHVASKYVITPERLRDADVETTDLMSRRAAEVSDLCLLFAGSVAPRSRILSARGSVLLVPDMPTRVVTLMALHRGVSAVLVGGPVAPGDPAVGLLAAADVPVVGEVAQLFTWIEAGDRVLVDGTTGRIRVHPSPLEVIRARRSRSGTGTTRIR